MFGWLVRGIIFLSGLVAGLFAAEGTPKHTVWVFVVALGLLTLCAALAAFWPVLTRRIQGRENKE